MLTSEIEPRLPIKKALSPQPRRHLVLTAGLSSAFQPEAGNYYGLRIKAQIEMIFESQERHIQELTHDFSETKDFTFVNAD